MQSKDQERAKFAYEKSCKAIKALTKGIMEEEEKRKRIKEFSSFVSGLPAMILQNGLGHTLCFLLAKAADQKNGCYNTTGKDAKHWLALDAIAEWLKNQNLLRSYDPRNPTEIVSELSRMNTLSYLSLQEEALRFLEWFKLMSKMFVEEKGA